MLTSAQKKVDAGVTQTIKLVKEGKYKGGVDGLFNVKNGGVGYGKVSAKAPARSALIAKLNTLGEADLDGQGQAPAHRYRQRLSGSQDRTTREGGPSSPPSLFARRRGEIDSPCTRRRPEP